MKAFVGLNEISERMVLPFLTLRRRAAKSYARVYYNRIDDAVELCSARSLIGSPIRLCADYVGL